MNLLLFKFFAIAILINSCSKFAVAEYKNDYCFPSDSCRASDGAGNVPHPNNCHQYFECNSFGVESVASNCSEGQYFNPDSKECEEEQEDEPCEEPCINRNCTYSCSDVPYYPFLIADLFDCSKYYLCIDEFSDPIEESCNETRTYFDGEKCELENYRCCDGCIPYCDKMFVETKDPQDCRSYYLCNELGIPKEELRFQCPEGEYFNPYVGHCEYADGVECRPFCDKSLPSTIISTTQVVLDKSTTEAGSGP